MSRKKKILICIAGAIITTGLDIGKRLCIARAEKSKVYKRIHEAICFAKVCVETAYTAFAVIGAVI